MTDDIRMHADSATFSLRTAALLCRDGMLLVQHERSDTVYALPGGTVQLGETTEAALARELREEIGIEATVNRLLWIEEAFWTYGTQAQHSICFYYLIDVPTAASLPTPDIEIPQRDNDKILLGWLPIDTLTKVSIYPDFLTEEITHFDDPIRHFVTQA